MIEKIFSMGFLKQYWIPIVIGLLILKLIYNFFTRYEIQKTKITVTEEEEEEDNSDDEEQEDKFTCDICGKESNENHGCHNCSVDACENCTVHFENAEVEICKRCIDKEYPREEKTKIVEKKIYIQPEEPLEELDEHEFD